MSYARFLLFEKLKFLLINNIPQKSKSIFSKNVSGKLKDDLLIRLSQLYSLGMNQALLL